MIADESADRVEQAATRIGSLIDERWEVDSLLGIGGMAAVYSARSGHERVAIKVLHPELTRSQRAVDRFRRESEALRAAAHPSVPRVRGEGTAPDGSPYLVMDLLLGETVEARRRRFGGKLASTEVVQIALTVLDVLDVAHSRGIVHRDVKPSNVLWLDDGSIRVIDFGIAKTADDDHERALTRTGALPGSLAFMSPEHALGVPGELDPRSDLWSLGATMFLLLSGRPVHESKTEVEALALAASRKARSLGSVVSDLSSGLVEVVDRALAFDRRKRFADAAAMREALVARCAVPGGAVHARPYPPRSVLAAAVVLGVSIVSLWSAHRGRAASDGIPHATASLPSVASSFPPSAESHDGGDPDPVAASSTVTPASAAPLRRSEHGRGSASPRSGHRALLTPAETPIPSAAMTAASPRCDPPFVIDPATGTRRVKPGC